MKHHFTRPRAIAATVLSLAFAGGLALFYVANAKGGVEAPSPPAAEVDVAGVSSTTITDFQSYSGRLEAVDKVDIKPLVGGTIIAVHFKDGTLVKKGDPCSTSIHAPTRPRWSAPRRSLL